MPEISRFFGIIIAMFYSEHNPPHFHVKYNEFRAMLSIKELTVLEGKLPPRVLGLVTEWASIHQNELMNNWNLAQQCADLNHINPLE